MGFGVLGFWGFGMPDDFTTTLFKRRWFIRGMKLHFYDERDHLMFLLKYGT